MRSGIIRIHRYSRFVVISLSFFLYFLTMSCSSKPPEHITHPGQLIYLGYKDTYASCARCHGKEGQGSMSGPEIHKALRKLSADKIRKYILEGKGTGDDAMPGFAKDFSSEEVDQIVDFLLSWKRKDAQRDSSKQDTLFNFNK